MEESSDEKIITQSIKGINYVRQPTLQFNKLQETKDFIEYEIFTKKNNDIKEGNNPLTNYLNSFIFCNETITIKQPKKSFMIHKKKKKFAYAVGMFPAPKTKKAAYLDGCLLAALGLKRQKTNADVICFITHDISKNDKEKLEVVFDKVIYVPYISPYDMGGKGKLKTILINKDLFNNCPPSYTKEHPYVHVFFKLHIFNPNLFPYEKVCFIDSDLVPLNYYDSLFMLNCPAGFVEYRKKWPYLEAHNWDRCDYLEHGKLIPKAMTDIDKKTGADVNAGLLLIKPDINEYNSMIQELTSPLDTWMGPKKYHKGFWNFNFDTPDGSEFVKNSYCFPEQNYLTKRYSGKWHYIEFAFQSWSLDPCNSFGIHMAAFNPKPWFKQPCGNLLDIKKKFQPYMRNYSKKKKRLPVALHIVDDEIKNENYENITFSYEIFNEVVIWGIINFPDLRKFIYYNTQINGTKLSHDSDNFLKLSKKDNIQSLPLKDIHKKNKFYKKLSLSQQYISDLINDFDNSYPKIKNKYLQICKSKRINKKENYDFDFKILELPDHIDLSQNKINEYLKKKQLPFSRLKGTPIQKLTKDQVKWILSTHMYKKNPKIRKALQKSHKKLITSLQKKKISGGKKTNRKPIRRSRRSRRSRRPQRSRRLRRKSSYRPYKQPKSVRCKVVGYHKNGIKVELPNKKIKNISMGVWPPYEKVYPLGTILPILKYPSDATPRSISGKYDVAGWYKPEILKKYPNKSAREI